MPYSLLSILDLPLIAALKNFDRWLFRKINAEWTSPFLDNIYPLWREAITWVPLYIFLLLVVFMNFGSRIWPWVVGLLVTVSLTDQISSHIIKPFIQRPRPCHDVLLADNIRLLLKYCSGSFSFTSSHATNHFGVAFFIYHTLKAYLGKWGYLFFFWAATISYGQVYIGVHYPLDILSGAILGSCIGYVTTTVFNKRFGLPPLKHQINPVAGS
jgi:membrane-associated phospholipid phosphatase